jgi:hypothetical protein
MIVINSRVELCPGVERDGGETFLKIRRQIYNSRDWQRFPTYSVDKLGGGKVSEEWRRYCI